MAQASQRKSRFTFTIVKDIFLLKTLMQVNPWEFGESYWDEAVQHFKTRGWEVTERTLKERVKALQKAYKMQTLAKTGTEEEKTERATLLEEIEKIIEAAEIQKIMVVHKGAENTEEDDYAQVSPDDSDGDISQQVNSRPPPVSISKDQLLSEKSEAESGRDNALKTLIQENTPPGPTTFRRKRARITEEELMEKRQDHDMYMDLKRIELEEGKEKRLREEGERRDEIAKIQLTIQQEHLEQQKLMMGILSKFVDK